MDMDTNTIMGITMDTNTDIVMDTITAENTATATDMENMAAEHVC